MSFAHASAIRFCFTHIGAGRRRPGCTMFLNRSGGQERRRWRPSSLGLARSGECGENDSRAAGSNLARHGKQIPWLSRLLPLTPRAVHLSLTCSTTASTQQPWHPSPAPLPVRSPCSALSDPMPPLPPGERWPRRHLRAMRPPRRCNNPWRTPSNSHTFLTSLQHP